MHQMDTIVTQVTMAMHISIALRKPTILMNNIFNPHEFDLYGRGQIVQPNRECVCFYRGTCKLGTSLHGGFTGGEGICRSASRCSNSPTAPDCFLSYA
ncbi:hypothetical protein ACFQT0_12935 [Hymenobacter humi]|uniref:Uncharacterized protein n=1 Tax=Hymenobacter humi TaxID=1411620 RepID=A0ABW2U3Y5_9BACT